MIPTSSNNPSGALGEVFLLGRPFQPPDGKKHPKRLTKAGAKILEDFFNNVSQNPSKQQREELVLKVKAEIGELDYYTEQHVSHWFTLHRRKAKSREKSTPSTGFPADKVAIITTLLQPLPDPPRETIILWAKLVGSTTDEVIGMIEQIKRGRASEMGRTPSQHKLPTPSGSTSPEPSSPMDFKLEASLSPSMSFKSPSLPFKSPAQPITAPFPEGSSEKIMPPTSEGLHPPEINHTPSKDHILELLQSCLRPQPPSDRSVLGIMREDEIDRDWSTYSGPLKKYLQDIGVSTASL